MAIRTLVAGSKDWEQGNYDQCVFETTYPSAVLSTFERNGYDDSDFIAVVWDAESEKVAYVEYATTRGWTYANSAKVDATDEARAAADAWYRARVVEARISASKRASVVAEVGRHVVVVKGRKVTKGTTGKVFWRGIDKFKSNRWADWYRVGIETADGEKVFLAEENVEVANPDQYVMSVEDASFGIDSVHVPAVDPLMTIAYAMGIHPR